MISSEQLLMDSQAAAAAIAAGRLLSLGLAKRQPAVLAFLAVTAAGYAALSLFPLQSASYFWGYVLSQGLSDLIAMAVVRELFSVIVAAYPGIQTATRWVMNGAVAVSALASLILSAALWGNGAPDTSNLFYLLVLHRSIVFSLAVIIISLLLFLSHYPLRLQKNTYRLSYFFSAVVLIDAADALVATLSPRMFSRQVDMAAVAAVAFCLVLWAILMRREQPLPQRINFTTPKEDELLQQLEALNRTLSRVARR